MSTTSEARVHPIVALWSHPRSMSTAVERVMRERGDFDCHHEPFMYYYYLERATRTFPHFEPDPRHPTRYEDIRAMLLDRAEAGPVFFKDMSYYVLERMLGDEPFASRLTNTFLIRDPARSIVSYHRLDPAFTVEEVGLEAECRHFRWLGSLLGETPAVIDAADVQADPEGIMCAYAGAIGVDFLPESLDFSEPPPGDWAPMAEWHRMAAHTGTIRTDHDASKSEDPLDVLDAQPRLRACYEHHLPFYEELHRHRLRAER